MSASPSAGAARAAQVLDRLLFLLALAGVVVAAIHRIVAYDIWWQIGAGRWIAAHGIPETDPFSYAALGRPWIEMRWLWCLAVAGLHGLAGANALILASATVVLAAGVALARLEPEAPGWVAAAGIAVAGSLALFRLDVRPEIASFLCLTLLLLWLARLRASRTAPPWWWVGLLQVVWTNTHTTSILGPAALAIFWCAEEFAARILPTTARGRLLPPERRRLALKAALAAGLASFVNPYGWRGATYFWTIWAELSPERFAGRWISELQSPFANFQVSFASLRLPAAAALCVFTFWRNRNRPAPGWVALWCAFLALAARAERNLALFGWVAGTTIILELATIWRSRKRPGAAPRGPLLARVVAIGLALLAIGAIASDAYYRRVDPDRRFGLGVAPGRFPDRPLAFLDRVGFDGRILANLTDNNYVLFARGERSVFVDGRLEVYDDRFLDGALELFRSGRGFDEVAAAHDPRLVLAESGRDGALLRLLLRRADWAPVYFDADRVVFARAPAPLAPDPLVERLRVDWTRWRGATGSAMPEGAKWSGDAAAPTPERLRGLGRLGVLVGNLETARDFDRRALAAGARGDELLLELGALERILGDDARAAGLLARVGGGERLATAEQALLAFASADGLEAALAGLETLVARGQPVDPRLLSQLLPWAARTGRLDLGARLAHAWVEREPGSDLAWKVEAAVAMARGELALSVSGFGRSLELLPQQPDAWIALARAHQSLGNRREASAALARALILEPQNPIARALEGEWAAASGS